MNVVWLDLFIYLFNMVPMNLLFGFCLGFCQAVCAVGVQLRFLFDPYTFIFIWMHTWDNIYIDIIFFFQVRILFSENQIVTFNWWVKY